MELTKLSKEFLNKGWGLRGLNKLFKKLQEANIENLSCFSIIRQEYVIRLQIFYAAILTNIIKIDQHLTE